MELTNPFQLKNASSMTATQAYDLWCDDRRLERAMGKENCFINGHRGTGKTMLFRVLRYDCQLLLNKGNPPSFLGVYVPVRDTDLATTEFSPFEQHELRHAIAESHLALHFVVELLGELQAHYSEVIPEAHRDAFSAVLEEAISDAYVFSEEEVPKLAASNFSEFLDQTRRHLRKKRDQLFLFVQRSLTDNVSFRGPLFRFEGFIAPIVDFLYIKCEKATYFLLDDADDLPMVTTEVLNSWISRRRESAVFKISTMYGYKTYRTRGRYSIQNPHDFYQYEVATRYLRDEQEDYVQLVRAIVEKRLKLAGNPTQCAEEFFPQHLEQQRKVEEVRRSLLEKYQWKYSKAEAQDYAYRHTTSEYMKQLHKSRSLDSFAYSGLKTIAALSSGLLRDFILCAQRMYTAESKGGVVPTSISPMVQSRVMRQLADEVLEETGNPDQKCDTNATPGDWTMVRRMIDAIGATFKAKMLSDDAERRVFSFAFHDRPDAELELWINLALKEGYLMKGFISRKDGNGRRPLYVLTRRLAPAFSLDPTAYSGYLSVTSSRFRSAVMEGIPIAVSSAQGEQLAFEWMNADELYSPEQVGF